MKGEDVFIEKKGINLEDKIVHNETVIAYSDSLYNKLESKVHSIYILQKG